MPAQWIAQQAIPRHTVQALEALPHVRGSGGQIDSRCPSPAEHAQTPSSTRTNCSSAPKTATSDDCDPQRGHIFLFANAQRNRLKLVFWDGSGLWVCAKRLEKGRFGWPEVSAEQNKVQLSHEELTLLLGGIELRQADRRRGYRRAGGERPV